jgi:hypothetical protein
MRPHKIATITKYIISTAALLVFVFKPIPARLGLAVAGGYANAGEEDITYTSVLKFSAGIIAAFSIHEGGHALIGWVTDTDMDWRWGDVNQPLQFTEDASSDSKGAAINAAGLITQAIGAEVILRADNIDKNDAFVRGMMAWNILNPILYVMDYWFFHKTNRNDGNTYQGDLAGVERSTNEATADRFALSMLGVAAFQGYRFLKTQPWAPDWLKDKSHSLNLEPLPSGGIVMTYEIVF